MKQIDFGDKMDDIVSSGCGWSEWHQEEVKDLFDSFENKELLNEYVQDYYNPIPEGVQTEELAFIADYLNCDVAIKFTQKV